MDHFVSCVWYAHILYANSTVFIASNYNFTCVRFRFTETTRRLLTATGNGTHLTEEEKMVLRPISIYVLCIYSVSASVSLGLHGIVSVSTVFEWP